MVVEIDDEVYKNLCIIAELRGIKIADIISELLNREVNKYAVNGKINLLKAKFWTNMLECSMKPDAVKNIVDVYVFSKAEIYGRPYYRVMYNGQMISVPYEAIEFYNKDDKYKVG